MMKDLLRAPAGFVFILSAVVVGDVFAQDAIPLGDEFRVNAYVSGANEDPAVAIDAQGDFVIVWESRASQQPNGIYGKRYDVNGVPVSGDFAVSSYSGGRTFGADVATTDEGSFTVVWADVGADGSGIGVYGQAFASDGNTVNDAYRLNTYAPGHQHSPAIANTSSREYVVVWENDQDNTVRGRRVNDNGFSVGNEFVIDALRGNPLASSNVDVAGHSSGGFMAAWAEPNSYPTPEAGAHVVNARVYHSGIATDAFQVNTYAVDPLSPTLVPNLAIDGNEDGYIVVWHSRVGSQQGLDIRAQRYALDGRRVGEETTLVATDVFGSIDVSLDDSGNATVAYGVSRDSDFKISAQRFSKINEPLGDAFELAVDDTGRFMDPVVASEGGRVIAAWDRLSTNQNPRTLDAFARVFDVDPPAPILITTWPSPVRVNHRFSYTYFAILSDSEFDALSIDGPSVRFGPGGAAPIYQFPYDIERDGDQDLLVVFLIPNTGITCSDSTAPLSGMLRDGRMFDVSLSLEQQGCPSLGPDLDIAVFVARPDPVKVGDEITYVVNVGNNGPVDAESFEVRFTIPPEIEFLRPLSRSCRLNGTQVRCPFGRLRVGRVSAASFIARASKPGQFEIRAAVSQAGKDPDPANNMRILQTTVTR